MDALSYRHETSGAGNRDNISVEGENAVIMMKGGKSARVRQVNMLVAKKIISDRIFTGEVKSEAERWYMKYTTVINKRNFL